MLTKQLARGQESVFPTVPVAIRRSGIGEKQFKRAIRAGEIPVYRLSARWRRVYWPEVVAWVRSHRIPGF